VWKAGIDHKNGVTDIRGGSRNVLGQVTAVMNPGIPVELIDRLKSKCDLAGKAA
jgi:hypothetical protein